MSVPSSVDTHILAQQCARDIKDAFVAYHTGFKEITRRARGRFEARDWHGAQADALERLALYSLVVDQCVAAIRTLLGPDLKNPAVWVQAKARYGDLIAGRIDVELAETFFNSITRRLFATVGVDPEIEYVDSDFALPPPESANPLYRIYAFAGDLEALVARVLQDQAFGCGYADATGDAARVAGGVAAALDPWGGTAALQSVEVLRPVFYRAQAAYLVGRLQLNGRALPLVLPLLNTADGIAVDTALLTTEEVSIVFSFTRSYFHVDVGRPWELIGFLKSIMPLKRIAELYISIGYHKHGKTELYRDLLHHLAHSSDRFEIARGVRGMVMAVFTMPDYDLVFKVIRDRARYPKRTSRQDVMARYQLVFQHDRVGRLVDAQEFEHVSFDRGRFSDELLVELLSTASQTVTVDGDRVVVKHLYIERRLTPLDLYLREAAEAAACAAVLDYGQAIKDLAATNIFPGDLLLRNFGVTRHGRVVFYDYDELTTVTRCRFRRLPVADSLEEDPGDGPRFYVGEHDIFPEEFPRFVGLRGALREAFIAAHGDLFGVDFWQQMQARLAAGEIIPVYPYREDKRFSR